MATTDAPDAQLVLTEDQAMDLVAFLMSAAEITMHEPTYYGTFRLADAASRLVDHMLEHDPQRSGEFLRQFKAELDLKKQWMMWDREAYFDYLRQAPAQVAAELKRLEATESVAAEEERS